RALAVGGGAGGAKLGRQDTLVVLGERGAGDHPGGRDAGVAVVERPAIDRHAERVHHGRRVVLLDRAAGDRTAGHRIATGRHRAGRAGGAAAGNGGAAGARRAGGAGPRGYPFAAHAILAEVLDVRRHLFFALVHGRRDVGPGLLVRVVVDDRQVALVG